MDRFQVTAKFGNSFDIVGPDSTPDFFEADALKTKFENVGREVRVHRIAGASSTLIYSTPDKATRAAIARACEDAAAVMASEPDNGDRFY